MEINTPDGNTNDSDKDLPTANPSQQYRGQEGESHSTATEGTLKTPDELPSASGKNYNEGEEQDLDDLVHGPTDMDDDEQQGGQATPLNKEQKFTPDDISS